MPMCEVEHWLDTMGRMIMLLAVTQEISAGIEHGLFG